MSTIAPPQLTVTDDFVVALEASIAIARVQNQQTFLCEFVLEQLELTVDLGSEEAQGAEYSSQKRRRLRGSVCARFGACSQC